MYRSQETPNRRPPVCCAYCRPALVRPKTVKLGVQYRHSLSYVEHAEVLWAKESRPAADRATLRDGVGLMQGVSQRVRLAVIPQRHGNSTRGKWQYTRRSQHHLVMEFACPFEVVVTGLLECELEVRCLHSGRLRTPLTGKLDVGPIEK